jgi:hypothetical protein
MFLKLNVKYGNLSALFSGFQRCIFIRLIFSMLFSKTRKTNPCGLDRRYQFLRCYSRKCFSSAGKKGKLETDGSKVCTHHSYCFQHTHQIQVFDMYLSMKHFRWCHEHYMYQRNRVQKYIPVHVIGQCMQELSILLFIAI